MSRPSQTPRQRNAHDSVVRTLPLHFGTDAELAGALAEGQPPAAAAAWDRFAQLVRSLLWKALGPNSDIDDLVQDVFITLFRRAKDLRDHDALSSFIVGITVRTARAELRRRRVRRWVGFAEDGVLPDVAVPEVDLAGRESARKLYELLDKLDSGSRLVFVLRHAQGLELAEVAEALGCSLATAKRKLAKANERVLFHAKREPALQRFAESSSLGSRATAAEKETP
jgi:RNA polymerase sigma-70 factor (ECF subfamily)